MEARGSINWVKLGDENTKFFHANASIEHRRNLITSLVNDSGTPLIDHAQKAEHLWQDFKQRLSTSKFSSILFDLPSLLS